MSAADLVLFSILGGTALLLYGVRMVGDGLQRAAGTRLRHLLSTLTGNRFKALLSSIFVAIQGRLLGALELFSGFVVVLATMIWLSLGFQILLLGAAWVRVRQAAVRS